MKPPKLSKRLQAAVTLVGHTEALADIGCDHGKLCVYCLATGAADKAVGVDISAPSLAKAERLAAEYDLPLQTRVGDGLKPLGTDEVETAVIAGMGGMEIARILATAPFAPPRLVLVPHKNTDAVTRYLFLAGYTVKADFVLLDEGHWYRALAAEGAAARPVGADWQTEIDALSPWENWYVGAQNADNPEYAAYKAERSDKLTRIVRAGNRDERVAAEIEYLNRI